MEGYFKSLSNKELAELSIALQGKNVGDITYCNFSEEFISSLSQEEREKLNKMKENNLAHKRFTFYMMSRKDLISRKPWDQVSFFMDDLNYEIIKRFEKLY